MNQDEVYLTSSRKEHKYSWILLLMHPINWMDASLQISLREMQLERLECALMKHKEMLVEAKGKERELQFLINDLRLTIEDLNEKVAFD